MKQLPSLFALIIVCLLIIPGCSKSDTSTSTGNGNPAPTDPGTLLQNKWRLVKDSLVTNNFAFPDGTIPIPGIYYGSVNDYYDFRNNGMVYIKEGGPELNSTYFLLSSTSLLITGFAWGNVTILTLTSNSFTWEKAITASNGGTYYRRVYFSR